ncbi:hypothetical protein HS048_20950 [Planomonospora sp. ID91781]|uniref:DUF6203 family protein n=1 Tax=Planomonospora TaxID=1998 RepID=UPI0012905720|nr:MULTISPECIES: DUF6203 family protein [Planomonospora]MBG0823203.1 hypothetical protein [Planomonospora sp. ID91781]
MRRLAKIVATRWLSRTPLGLAVLGAGWLLGRRRRRRAAQAGAVRGSGVRRAGRRPVDRARARR